MISENKGQIVALKPQSSSPRRTFNANSVSNLKQKLLKQLETESLNKKQYFEFS
jgi:hypothetical protein